MPIIDDTKDQEINYDYLWPTAKPASQVQEDNVINRSEYINSSPEEYSMTDFRNNVSYKGYKPLDLGERVLEYVNNSEGMAKYIADPRVTVPYERSIGMGALGMLFSKTLKTGYDDDDVVDHLRRQEFQLFNPAAVASIVEDAPEDIKLEAQILREIFEETKVKGGYETADAIIGGIEQLAKDPVTYIGTGLGLLGRSALLKIAEKSNLPMIKKLLGTSVPALLGQTIPAGAMYGGIGSYGHQNLNIALDVQDEIDMGKIGKDALATGLGAGALTLGLAGAGAGIGFGVSKIFKSKLDAAEHNKMIDEEIVEDSLKNEVGIDDRPTIAKDEVEPDQMMLPFYNEIENFIEETKVNIPIKDNVPQVSKFEEKQARAAARRTKLEEKDERLYGGFVPDSVVAKIAKDYEFDKDDIVEELIEYEASRDFPSWETISETANSPLYAERTFREKAMTGFKTWKEQKQYEKKIARVQKVAQSEAEKIKKAEDLEDLEEIDLQISKAMAGVEAKATRQVEDVAVDHYDALIRMAQEMDSVQPEQISLDFAQDFVKKVGSSGQRTIDEVADIHQQLDTGQITPDGARASLSKIVQKIHGKYLFGRPTKVVTKFTDDSEDARELSNKMRFDANRTYTSEAEAVGNDYNENFREYAGSLYAPFMQAMNSITELGRGVAKDVLNIELKRAILGTKSKYDFINKASSEIRTKVLDKVARDNDDFNLDAGLDLKYFPRLWDRTALVKDFYGTKYQPMFPFKRTARRGAGANRFAKLLVEDGEAPKRITDTGQYNYEGYVDETGKYVKGAYDIIEGMLDKKSDVLHSSGNSFFTKRKFNKITDDNKYEEFLDNNVANVMYNYINQSAGSYAKVKAFGVRNIDEFEAKWIDGKDLSRTFLDENGNRQYRNIEGKGIANQVEAKGNEFSPQDRKDILDLYRSMTGDDLKDYGPGGQFARDLYVTPTRMATLSLTTISSLTEVMINMQRAGAIESTKGFAKAAGIGTKYLTKMMADKLRLNHNLSEPEVINEMREFFMFVDNAAASSADRLADASIRGAGFRAINNGYFKINLLTPWTRLVELTSFLTSKSMIHRNLKAISDHGSLAPSARIRTFRDQLKELNVDIDEGLKYIERNGGEVNKKDPFYTNVKKGAARYTGDVILDTSGRAAVKPALISDPRTAMLFQLMGYPAAFSNVVLKNFARGLKNPYAASQTIGTALAMTVGAVGANYLRSDMKDKDPYQIFAEGVARWGGNGILLDQFQRVSKSFEASGGNEFVAGSGFFGPLGQDVGRGFAYGNPLAILGAKTPGYGAIKLAFGEDVKKDYDDFWRDLGKDKTRRPFEKGGVVEDVPRVPKEPDERIDKMTGLPYDEQAGEAFEDVEDRQKFVIGGLARVMTKALTRKGSNIPQSKIDEAANNIEEGVFYAGDPDMPEDPLMGEYIERATRSLLDEKNDKSMSQLKEEFPEFIDDKGQLIMGRDFSKARGYTDDEIANYEREGELEDLLEVGQDFRFFIQEELDKVGARQTPPSALDRYKNYKTEVTIREMEAEDPQSFYEYKKDIILSAQQNSNKIVGGLNSEEIKMLESFAPNLPKVTKKEADLLAERTPERETNLKELLEDSVEKNPFYRATRNGFQFEYEEAAVMPFETGMHVGPLEQADVMAARGFGYKFDPFFDTYKDLKEKTREEFQYANNVADTDTASDSFVRPVSINKGYVFVKRPLTIDDDFGSWKAEDLIEDAQQLKSLINSMVNANPSLRVDTILPEIKKIQRLSKNHGDWESSTDLDAMDEFLYAAKKQIRLAHLNNQFKDMIKKFGFDSIRYKNVFETPKNKKPKYSYILFEPNQYKSVGASEFDIGDPRQNIRTGGLLRTLQRKKAA